MTSELVPHAYQTSMIDYIINNKRCGVYAGMGLGKTVSTLTALDHLSLIEDIYPVLVLAPLRVASATWPDEVEKWEHLKDVTMSPVVGTLMQRKAALAKPADIYTMNYENLPWLLEHMGGDWPFKTVVADESTRLKSFRLRQGSKRARALAKVAHLKVERFIQLTGTPSPNGLQDLWGQVWFLDKGERLGRNYSAFQGRWFQAIRVGADVHAVKYVPTDNAQGDIEGKLKDVCLALDAKDYFDLAEPIVNVIRVELPLKSRKLYKQMEKEMFMELDCGTEIEAFNAASRTIKCLQLANGAVYNDSTATDFTEIHDAKVQALQSIVEEAAGAPVLVAYHFKSDLSRLLRAFPTGRQLDKSPETISEWNRGEIPVLFANPASAGHGINLQDGGNIIVFFGHWWDLEQFQQIIERIGPTRQKQSGHNRPVFIHHIVAANTVDEIVMKRRESKRAVQDLLMEALKQAFILDVTPRL